MEEISCFTFTWKLVNFSFYESQKDQDLPSPYFSAVHLNWELQLSPKAGQKSELFRLILIRKFDGKLNVTDEDFQFDCELSFLASDGTALRNHKTRSSAIISKNLNCYCADFLPRNVIFGSKRDLFLPKDTLTVRCRIWKKGIEADHYMAQTVFHRKKFFWNILSFDMTNAQVILLELASRYFDITLSKCTTQSELAANIEISKTQGDCICWANCKIRVLSEDGKERAILHDYDSEPYNLLNLWRFPIILKSEDISPNGTLSLQWEFTVGVSEVSPTAIQSTSEQIYEVPQNYYDHAADPCAMRKDMFDLYKAQKLCDVTLRTGDVSFHVHKCVMGARSSVLCAIFENETGEHHTEVVDIPDIDEHTLKQMILFLYTDSLENIHCEEASKMYYAADKYAIQSLKEKCLSVLKTELSLSNVCRTVLLAHTHHDEDLMQSAQEFICEHDEIVQTEEWSCLESSHPQLTIKILRAIVRNVKRRKIT